MAKPVTQRTVVSSAFADAKDLPKELLASRLKSMKEYLVDAVERDCRRFAKVIPEWRDYGLYKEFAKTWEEFTLEHLQKPPEWLDLMIQGVAILDQKEPGKPQQADQAVSAAIEALNRPGAPAKVNPAKVAELRAQGMTQQAIAEQMNVTQQAIAKAESKPDTTNYDNIIISCTPKTKQQGTSKGYLQRRLATEAPELLEEVGKGKRFKSVRAAAIEAGIVPASKTFRVTDKTNPQDLALKLVDELPGEFVELLAAALLEVTQCYAGSKASES